MLSAAFLPALILVSGQLFPRVPVTDAETFHVHVAKGGHWTCKHELTCHLRTADEADTTKAFEEIFDGIRDLWESEYNAEWDCQVKVTDEKRGTIVFTGKGDDVVELLELLRDVLGLERCAFSWDRSCLQIGGFSPRTDPSAVGSLIGAIASAVLFGDAQADCKAEMVLTTDGRFIAEHLPAKIDEDGCRLVLDLANENESPEQERTLRIEGLEE